MSTRNRFPSARAARAISSIEPFPSDDQVEWQCSSPTRSPTSTSCREASVPGRLELATVLAQLRRDQLVAQEAVELFLGPEAVHLTRLGDRDAVLRDREPSPLGLLAERDVVVSRPREVLQQAAEVLRRDDSQVEPEPLLRDDGGLRVAVRGHLEHPGQRDEVRRQRRGVGGGRDHVEIPEGLLPAPHASRARDVDRRRGARGAPRRRRGRPGGRRRAGRGAPAPAPVPSRARRGCAPRSSHRGPAGPGRAAARPPPAARRGSSRRAPARSARRSSARGRAGGRTG